MKVPLCNEWEESSWCPLRGMREPEWLMVGWTCACATSGTTSHVSLWHTQQTFTLQDSRQRACELHKLDEHLGVKLQGQVLLAAFSTPPSFMLQKQVLKLPEGLQKANGKSCLGKLRMNLHVFAPKRTSSLSSMNCLKSPHINHVLERLFSFFNQDFGNISKDFAKIFN